MEGKMRELYLVDKKKESIVRIADILNNSKILFKLDLDERGSDYNLEVMTDAAEATYRANKRQMLIFLKELKDQLLIKEDIEELISELKAN